MAEKKFAFESIFEGIIEKGHIEKEILVTDGLTIVMRPLSTQEHLNAESIVIATNRNIPGDVLLKLRSIKALSMAIVQVNGIVVGNEENERLALLSQLRDMPDRLLDKINMAYRDLLSEQEALYDPKELKGQVENFSKPQ